MKKILILNGRILDPDTGTDEIRNLYLEDGKIADETGVTKDSCDEVIDASGCWVMPGLIDLHVHLRDPGLTWKEDIASGARAAAHGGVTTVVAMPNTKPTIDSADRLDYVMNKASHVAVVNVLQAGSATRGLAGDESSELREMAAHGMPAVSEDGRSVMNAALMSKVLKECADLNIPFLDHCEDISLVRGGCVNADANSEKEGLPGITNTVEEVIVARDILLAHEAGAHLHLCHCSTEGSYEMLKLAKEKGMDVSGEVCPHHFLLTSDDRIPGDTNYKMNPPLRTAKDKEALIKGLAEDVFEVISTDHAPHSAAEKNTTMQKAPFGIVGLETSAALTITGLVKPGYITPMQMAAKMSTNPARILHLTDRGSLAKGKRADVVIIDPEEEYTIDPKKFVSRGKNTPFGGMKVNGKVKTTICGGEIVYQEGRTLL